MQEAEDRLPTLFLDPLMRFFVGLACFIALINGRWDLTFLSFLLLSMAYGAKIWSRLSLNRVICSYKVDKTRVFPKESLNLEVQVENSKFLPIWLRMHLPLNGSMGTPGGEVNLTKESGLLWYQRVTFVWTLSALRRGVHSIGPPSLEIGDLLGFYRKKKRVPQVIQVLVYPRLVALKSFPLPKRELFGIPGSPSPVSDPVYLLGTRDYQPWRPARYIHWKASARHCRLQEKVCETTVQTKVLLAVDVEQFAGKHAEEDFEKTLEVVASLAVSLDKQGCPLGLIANGLVEGGRQPVVPVARSAHQLPAILEMLARLRLEPGEDLTLTLKDALGVQWGVTCVHFAYEADGSSISGEFFSKHKIPTVMISCRPGGSEAGESMQQGIERYTLNDILLSDDSAHPGESGLSPS
jgi:uncharacterized protein (DUF58 family)